MFRRAIDIRRAAFTTIVLACGGLAAFARDFGDTMNGGGQQPPKDLVNSTCDLYCDPAVDASDVLVTADGVYTLTIQITAAVSGLSTLYRGPLQLYQ
jgi:hypothetical protein